MSDKHQDEGFSYKRVLKRAWVQDPNQELRVLLLKVLPDSGIGPFDGNFLIQLNKPHDGFIEMNITKIVDSDYTTDFVGFVNVCCQIQTKQGQKRLDRAVNIEIIRLNVKHSSGPPPRLKHTGCGKTVKGGTVND